MHAIIYTESKIKVIVESFSNKEDAEEVLALLSSINIDRDYQIYTFVIELAGFINDKGEIIPQEDLTIKQLK